LVKRGEEVIEKLLAAIIETRRQVHHQATDAEIRRRQSSTRRCLDQVQDLFALAETVKEDRHGPDVERVRSEPDEMRADTLQLAHQHANRLRALGNLEAEKLLARHHVS